MEEIRIMPRPTVAAFCDGVDAYFLRCEEPRTRELSQLAFELENHYRTSRQRPVPCEPIRDDLPPGKLQSFAATQLTNESLVSPLEDSVTSTVVFNFLRNLLSTT